MLNCLPTLHISNKDGSHLECVAFFNCVGELATLKQRRRSVPTCTLCQLKNERRGKKIFPVWVRRISGLSGVLPVPLHCMGYTLRSAVITSCLSLFLVHSQGPYFGMTMCSISLVVEAATLIKCSSKHVLNCLRHYILVGIDFEICTDHKLLVTIFGPQSRPPSSRIESWLLNVHAAIQVCH